MTIKINLERDKLFDALGLQRLRESYMMENEVSPQERFAYVSEAFGSNPEHAQRLYEYSSQHWLSYSTPILSFGRSKRGLPISCFLNYMEDSAEGLVDNLSETNWLSMLGGGVGVHLGIRNSDDKSTGVMPHLKMYDASSLAYRQGRTRRGSYAAFLDISHPDIIQFLEMRKPTGDQNQRCLNLHHGINITDEENENLRADAYVDLHFRAEGEIARWLQLAFVADWLYAGGRFKADARYFLPPPAQAGPVIAQVLAAGPDTPWEPIHRAQVEAITGARKRVLLVTPYFVPSEAAMMALTSAALSGVDTALVVPRQSDSRMVTLAARSYFDVLAEAGVRVYEFPRMLHTKALLVDDGTVILGSANFDRRSFRLNFELSVLFEDADLGDRLARILYGYLGESRRFDPKQRLPLGERLAQAGARLFSPLL